MMILKQILHMKDKKIFRPNLFPPHEHVCSINFCEPLNNFGLFKKFEISQDFPDSLYICKYGQVHDCSVENCGYDDPCSVSGIIKEDIVEMSNYDKNDSRTWSKVIPKKLISEKKAEVLMKKWVGKEGPKAPPFPPSAPGFPPKKSNYVKDAHFKVEYIVETILYSANRKKINEEKYNIDTKMIKRDKVLYISDCAEKQIPVNLIKLSMIECIPTGNVFILKILKRDQNIINRYVNMIMQFYNHSVKYLEDKVSPESIALGVLYKMQQGMIVDGVVLIPIEQFLIDHLPLMNDLNKLKIDKKKYTLGERLIFQTFENARKKGVSNQELALKEEVLNEQNYHELGTVEHCSSKK